MPLLKKENNTLKLRGLGNGSVIYMAAILGIDESIYETAYVDGASNWNRIRHLNTALTKTHSWIVTKISPENTLF